MGMNPLKCRIAKVDNVEATKLKKAAKINFILLMAIQ